MKTNIIKKIMILILGSLCLFSTTFGAVSDNTYSSYKLDNSMSDESGNGRTATNSGMNYISSAKIDGGFEVDDLGDYIIIEYPTSGDWTWNMWKYTTGETYLFDSRITSTTNSVVLSNGKWCSTVGGSGSNLCFYDNNNWYVWTGSTISNNVWEMITLTYNSSSGQVEAFVNGVSQGTITISTGKTIDTGGGLISNYLTGTKYDEVSTWSRILSSSEISDLYNSGDGVSYPFIIASTPTINHNVSDFYNSENISIQLNTSTNTNMSYVLDGGNETSICDDCNSSVLNLYSLNETTHNIIFISTDENGQVNSTANFTIDVTNPSLEVNNFTEVNSYEVNFSNLINYSDNNLDSCIITLDNSSQYNCNETINFTTNGNHTYNVSVNDLAGNKNESFNNIIFTNPFFYVYFYDENSTLITNFSINGTNYNETFKGKIYDYGLGSHFFEFSKLGFVTILFQLTFNETSNINTSFSMPASKINIKVYDITDYSLITGQNITIEIIGNSFSNIYTTDNGSLRIQNLLMASETYSVIVSSVNYETASMNFNFNNQEELNLSVYLTPLSLNNTLIADIIVKVVDEYKNPLQNLNVYQYVWDSGQGEYVQNNLKKTDYYGKTSFKVFLNTKRYNFCAEYQGNLICLNDLFININTEELVIEISTGQFEINNENNLYDIDFSYSLTNSSYNLSGVIYNSITFSWNNPNQDVDKYCLIIYDVENQQKNIITSQCSNSHYNALSVDVVVNSSKNYLAEAIIIKDGNSRLLYTLNLYSQYSLQAELKYSGLISIIVLGLLSFVISLGLNKRTHDVNISHYGVSILTLILVFIFPDYISFNLFVIVALINLYVVQINNKRDDTNNKTNVSILFKVLLIYMLFIGILVTALTEMENKGVLDDYGYNILYGDSSIGQKGLIDKNNEFSLFIDEKTTSLKEIQKGVKEGTWDLFSSSILKILEFVDLFFTILSNLFNIVSNIGLLLGITNSFLISIFKLFDFIVLFIIVYIYFKEAFK